MYGSINGMLLPKSFMAGTLCAEILGGTATCTQFTSVLHVLSSLLPFMLLVLLIEDYALTFLYI